MYSGGMLWSEFIEFCLKHSKQKHNKLYFSELPQGMGDVYIKDALGLQKNFLAGLAESLQKLGALV